MFRNVHGKLGRMRKAVDWTVCPVSNTAPEEITIQSERYIARYNKNTKKVVVSDGKGGHPGFHKLLPLAGAKEIPAPEWLIQQIEELEADHGETPSGPVTIMDENGPAPTVRAKSAPVSIFDL